jgi:hypothetical protein
MHVLPHTTARFISTPPTQAVPHFQASLRTCSARAVGNQSKTARALSRKHCDCRTLSPPRQSAPAATTRAQWAKGTITTRARASRARRRTTIAARARSASTTRAASVSSASTTTTAAAARAPPRSSAGASSASAARQPRKLLRWPRSSLSSCAS